MSELEHYGMKERSASAKDAEETTIGQAAPPAEAAEAAEAAEPAESAECNRSNNPTNAESAAPEVRKISLVQAFGEEDRSPDSTHAASSEPLSHETTNKGEAAARDPFEPAPPSPDTVVTNVMPASSFDASNASPSGFDPFAPSTPSSYESTTGNPNAYEAPVGYTPTYEATSAAYLQAAYNQAADQAQAQNNGYASAPSYQGYDYGAPRNETKAIGALVCGILSLLFCWTMVPSIILGIVAIVLAGSYADLWGKSGKTTAAKVTGVLGIVASTLVLAFMLLSFALFNLAENLPYSINSDSSSTAEESSFLDLLPLDEFSSIVTGKDSPNAPLSGQERFAAEAAMDALKQIPKNTTMLTTLGTNADEYFADMNGGIRLKDIGLSGSDVVRWLVDNMQCSVANDGVFITDDSTAMVFVDATAPTMWTYTDAATQSFEQKYGEAEMDTEREYLDALGDAYKTASTTAEVEDKYLSLNLTNRNGAWVVDSDSLLQQAQYLFDLWS